MASHSSATAREATPHVNRTSRTNTIINALKQRAHAVLNDTSIHAQSRAIIRYALEINDPWLARLVRRAESGETILDAIDSSDESQTSDDDGKIEALTEMICLGGEESVAALLVLMVTLENSTRPTALANKVKHFAFNRSGMVDAQIAVIEGDLFAGKTHMF